MSNQNHTARGWSEPVHGAESSKSGSTPSPLSRRTAISDGPPRSATFSGNPESSSTLNTPFTPSRRRAPTIQDPIGTPSRRGGDATTPSSHLNSSNSRFETSPPSAGTTARGPGPQSSNWREGAGPERLKEQSAPYEQHLYSRPKTIIVENERTRVGNDPSRPYFLSRFPPARSTEDYQNVLNYLSKCTFVIDSNPGLNYMHAFLNSPHYPHAAHAIHTVYFPKMYWFSGVSHNRKENPFLAFLTRLPAIQEVTITFHTAGLTASAYNERDRLRFEATDLEKSKVLKVIRLPDLTRHYGLNQLFACKTLKTVHLECVESEMVAYFTRHGDPLSPFRDLIHWIQQGFRDAHGTEVQVDAKIIAPQ